MITQMKRIIGEDKKHVTRMPPGILTFLKTFPKTRIFSTLFLYRTLERGQPLKESIMKKSGYIVGEFRGDIVGTHTHINPYKSATFDTQIKDVLEKRKDSEFKRIIIYSTPDLIINLGLDADNVSVKKSVVLHHSRKPGHLSTAEEWCW